KPAKPSCQLRNEVQKQRNSLIQRLQTSPGKQVQPDSKQFALLLPLVDWPTLVWPQVSPTICLSAHPSGRLLGLQHKPYITHIDDPKSNSKIVGQASDN